MKKKWFTINVKEAIGVQHTCCAVLVQWESVKVHDCEPKTQKQLQLQFTLIIEDKASLII